MLRRPAKLTRRGAPARVTGARNGRLGREVVPVPLKVRLGSSESGSGEKGSLRSTVGSPEAARRRADLIGHDRSAGAPRHLGQLRMSSEDGSLLR